MQSIFTRAAVGILFATSAFAGQVWAWVTNALTAKRMPTAALVKIDCIAFPGMCCPGAKLIR